MSAGKRTILVVEDDVHMCKSVVEVLERKGYVAEKAANGAAALEILKTETFDCIISDVKMPAMTGIELLEKVHENDETIPFIIMTAFGDVSLAVDAMKKGAFDFIEKNADLLRNLEFAVDRALKHQTLITENKRLRSALEKRWDYVGQTLPVEKLRELIHNIARSRSTVLITGESGTGKELVARSIHYQSNRSHAPFIKINCAALPEGLIESELFGHEKGAFTGALKTKAGKFELASGGTLLLDEIGEMPVGLQAKLLRVLQEREINKVGGDEPIAVDVRIIATSNRDLDEQVRKNQFREDLYYRLAVFHVKLPPLRERMDDIRMLADHFIGKYNEENGFNVAGIEDAAVKALLAYTWPGNIRELENTIERAVVLTKTGMIGADVLALKVLPGEEKDGGLAPGITVAEAEKKLILSTLEFCSQNRTRAAEMLDISIRTLRNKLNEYGILRE